MINTPQGTPSAGASPEGAGAAPSPSVDTSQLTDDQILDLEPTGEEAVTPEPGAPAEGGEAGAGEEGKPLAEGEKPPAKPEGEKPAEEQPEGAIEESEQLKGIFKTPGVGPDLRRAWYAEKAYREVFPTVAEAREIRTIFPSAAEAKAAQEAREEFGKFDDLYFANNPESHTEFLKSMREANPEVFRSFAGRLGDSLWAVDPEAYRADTRNRIETTLTNLHQQATQSQDENLKNAVDVIAMRLLDRTLEEAPRQPDPREVRLSQREEAIQQREKQAADGAFQGFYNSALTGLDQKLVEAAESLVTKALGEKIAQEDRADITDEICMAVMKTLQADRYFKTQWQRAFAEARNSRNYGDEQQAAIVSLGHSRAGQVLPKVSKEILAKWSRRLVAGNQERLKKQGEQAARVDITGGAPTPPKKKELTPRDIDYTKMTDDQILEA